MAPNENGIIFTTDNDFFGKGLTIHYIDGKTPFSILVDHDPKNIANCDQWDIITVTELFDKIPDEYFKYWPHQIVNPHPFGDKFIMSLREANYFHSIETIKDFVKITSKKKRISLEDMEYIIKENDYDYLLDCLIYSEMEKQELKRMMDAAARYKK